MSIPIPKIDTLGLQKDGINLRQFRSDNMSEKRMKTLLAENPYFKHSTDPQTARFRRQENVCMTSSKESTSEVEIVIGGDDSTDKMISLGIRQPSFRSITGSLILKDGCGFENNNESVIHEEESVPVKIDDNDATHDVRQRMRCEMSAMNKSIWKEIGYDPSEIG